MLDRRLLDRVQEPAQLAADVTGGLHRTGVPRSGDDDELGSWDGLLKASPIATGARTSCSAYSRRVGTSISASTWPWSGWLARAIARKPTGWNARTLSRNGATRASSAEDENMEGAMVATNSSGASLDASSERVNLLSASSWPSEPTQPA
jgi:hypothetical protein